MDLYIDYDNFKDEKNILITTNKKFGLYLREYTNYTGQEALTALISLSLEANDSPELEEINELIDQVKLDILNKQLFVIVFYVM